METKRYQVFVSSTYTDLTKARHAVLMQLLTMDCLPAGMELFGAVDEDQFEFIKRVIDDSDYYVLIIAGRYGTPAADGVSYTEKEYDYAVSTGKKVLAFLHGEPGKILSEDSEQTEEGRKKLAAFIAKVNRGRLRTTWTTAEELAAKVATALMRTFRLNPAVGWVRANTVANVEALSELNELRKEVERLRPFEMQPAIENLAALDEGQTFSGTSQDTRGHRHWWNAGVTWRLLFAALLPHLMGGLDESIVQAKLSGFLHARCPDDNGRSPEVADESLQRIKVQLLAHKAIDVSHTDNEFGPPTAIWKLTEAGRRIMLDAGAVRAGNEIPWIGD